MNNKKRIYTYINFTLRFLTIFIVFQIFGNLTLYIKNQFFMAKSEETWEKVAISNGVTGNNGTDYIIINEADSNNLEDVVSKYLDYSKSSYQVLRHMDEITEDLQKSIKVVFLCDNTVNAQEKQILNSLLNKGISIVFLQIPDSTCIKQQDLFNMLGIKEDINKISQKGIRFISDFLLGGRQDYPNIKLEMLSVKLKSTCKTYVYGLAKPRDNEKITNEELPPIIWRNSYYNGQVFVVNGSLINSDYGYGIIPAMLAQLQEDYIYPAVNGLAMIIQGFPYFENVNEYELQSRYSTNALGLQQDILWPSIISISKKHDIAPGFFMAQGMDTVVDSVTKKALAYYIKEIKALGGDIGALQDDIVSFEGTQLKRWDTFTNYNESGEKSTIIPITLDGFTYTDKERLAFYSRVTALGIITQRTDMKSILYPINDDYDWVKVSVSLDTLIGRLRKEFAGIDSVNITELTKRMKGYQLLEPVIQYKEDSINIHMQRLNGNGYFILRTNKKIDSIRGGRYKQMEECAYLIEAQQNDIIIKMYQD